MRRRPLTYGPRGGCARIGASLLTGCAVLGTLAGCPASPGGSELTAGDYKTTRAKILADPQILAFGTAYDELTFRLQADSERPLPCRIISHDDWLSVEPDAGHIDGAGLTVHVRVDRTLLPAGDHMGTIRAEADGFENSYVTALATVTESADDGADDDGGTGTGGGTWFVGERSSSSGSGDQGSNPELPKLETSTDVLDFGSEAVQQSFFVRNGGGGTLNYTLRSGVAWASAYPESGTLSAGQEAEIRVQVDREGLSPDDYAGVLDVRSDDDQSATLTLLMTVPVQPPPFELSDDQLDFGEDGLQRSFTVRPTAALPLSFSIAATANWMDIKPTTFACEPGQEVTVSVTVSRCANTWVTGPNEAELIVAASSGHQIVVPVTAVRAEAPPQDEILQWLQDLPPLPKVHYSWATPLYLQNDPNSPLVHEWVRITHAYGLQAFWATPQHVANAAAACKRVNDTGPEIQASINLCYSPWHRVLPAGLPPTYEGPEVQQELDVCLQRFTNCRTWLNDANAALGANIAVTAILLDTERWLVKEFGEPGREEWNAALTVRYNQIYAICKSVFPEAGVHWYYRGLPCCWRLFTLDEQGDSYSSGAYDTADLPLLRRRYRNVYAEAQAHGGGNVYPWIALAEGYFTLPSGDYRYYCDLNYALELSWQLGAELNIDWYAQFPDEYAPWDAAEFIVIYPGPFHARAPHFAEHFVAYVRGASGLPLNP